MSDDGPWSGLPKDVYCANELAFALPERAWKDRTTHVLDAPTEGERRCSFAIQRTRLEPGQELDVLIAGALRRADREKLAHEVLRRNARVIASRAGFDLAVRWRGAHSMAYTCEAHLAAGGFWLVFGFTGALEDAAICDRHLERLIETLRLRT